VKSSKANLDRIKTNLNYATITSPIDGVVISRNVDVGQTVAASLQAPTLFTIAQDLTKMQVKTSIDEADIGRIKDGQDAIFTVDAYPEQKFEGIVKQIRLAPEVVQNVVSYDVILEVSNPDMLLKPGMTANVTIEIDRQDDILKVASAALRYHPVGDKTGSSTWRRDSTDKADNPGAADSMISSRHEPSSDRPANRRRLWILDPQGKPEPIPVQIGISDGVFTQVISDKLKEGDKVITGVEGVTPATNSQVNPFAPRFPGGRR
jgi:HlyD family secretion protein